MGVDTSPGCRLGRGVRTEGWLLWESCAGDGGCSAVFPGTGCWPKLTWLAPCWDSSERVSISTEVEEKENHIEPTMICIDKDLPSFPNTDRRHRAHPRSEETKNISRWNATGYVFTSVFCTRAQTLKGG